MKRLSLLASTILATTGCVTDDDTELARTFTVRVENVAPWTVLKSGVANTKLVPSPGPLSAGESYETTFTAGKNQRLGFAAMLGESNDWFFGPGPDGILLYDAAGMARSGDVTAEISLWNAGTEIDQEPAVGDSTGPRQPAPDYGAPDPIAMVRELGNPTMLSEGSPFTLPAIAEMIRVTVTPGANRQFTIRISNVSTASTLVTSLGAREIHISPLVWALHTAPAPIFVTGEADRGQGLELIAESGRGGDLSTVLGVLSGASTAISPGVWAVHQGDSPLYRLGVADAALGLERIAEDGNPAELGVAVSGRMGVLSSGVFNTPVGASQPGAARPGGAYELAISAEVGDRLSFVTMFGWSNDWFFATPPDGIELFDVDGTPISGDISAELAIYDVGTELDQELAIGADTGPQQAGPDTGARDPIDHVREVPATRHAAPASTHLRVTVTAM